MFNASGFISGCSSTQKEWGKNASSKENFNINQNFNNTPFAEPKSKQIFYQKGIASYYNSHWKGLKTASGERYDPKLLTAASKTLPINTIVMVKSINNGRYVIVRINDRGPYSKNRVIDLSEAAAKKIGLYKKGLAKVDIFLLR